jgi:hypothetical protein
MKKKISEKQKKNLGCFSKILGMNFLCDDFHCQIKFFHKKKSAEFITYDFVESAWNEPPQVYFLNSP